MYILYCVNRKQPPNNMSTKKVTKHTRYPKSSISLGKIAVLITNSVFKWRFLRSGQVKRNISTENIEDLVLISDEEMRSKPQLYTRLTAIDFYVILMWMRQGKKYLDKFKGEVFYFSTNPLITAERVKIGQNKKRRHHICMEEDHNSDTWVYHIRDLSWIKRPDGHKIICLKKNNS